MGDHIVLVFCSTLFCSIVVGSIQWLKFVIYCVLFILSNWLIIIIEEEKFNDASAIHEGSDEVWWETVHSWWPVTVGIHCSEVEVQFVGVSCRTAVMTVVVTFTCDIYLHCGDTVLQWLFLTLLLLMLGIMLMLFRCWCRWWKYLSDCGGGCIPVIADFCYGGIGGICTHSLGGPFDSLLFSHCDTLCSGGWWGEVEVEVGGLYLFVQCCSDQWWLYSWYYFTIVDFIWWRLWYYRRPIAGITFCCWCCCYVLFRYLMMSIRYSLTSPVLQVFHVVVTFHSSTLFMFCCSLPLLIVVVPIWYHSVIFHSLLLVCIDCMQCYLHWPLREILDLVHLLEITFILLPLFGRLPILLLLTFFLQIIVAFLLTVLLLLSPGDLRYLMEVHCCSFMELYDTIVYSDAFILTGIPVFAGYVWWPLVIRWKAWLTLWHFIVVDVTRLFLEVHCCIATITTICCSWCYLLCTFCWWLACCCWEALEDRCSVEYLLSIILWLISQPFLTASASVSSLTCTRGGWPDWGYYYSVLLCETVWEVTVAQYSHWSIINVYSISNVW